MHALLLYPLYAFAAYVSIMLSLFALYHFLPSPPNILGFIARCMAGYISLLISASYGTFACAVLRACNLHYAYGQWTTGRSFKWLCRYTMGVKFEVIDDGRKKLDAKRPVLLVMNHQTELDVLLLGTMWPTHCSITAKKSIARIPFLGWFMSLSGAVFIDRADRNQALKAFEGAAKTMRDLGQSVLLFPEGTRSYSTEPMLLPFKKGAFHLAIQAGVDVLPVVAENYSKVLNLKAKRFNAGTVRVKGKSCWKQISQCTHSCLVLDPIPTKGMTPADVNKLSEDVRNMMLETLYELSGDKESKAVKAHAS